MPTSIRLLDDQDIPRAMELVLSAGWNQTAIDWRRLLRYQPDGCFAAVADGFQGAVKLQGTVTTTSYGNELAWIGMMLVDPAHQRRGIGGSLMKCAMNYLIGNGVTKIKLDATPIGKMLYEQLGFREEFVFRRWWRGLGPAMPSSKALPNRTALLDGDFDTLFEPIAEMDRMAFGADRRRWLRELSACSSCIFRKDGYGMLRAGRVASYLGPIVASDIDDAESIIHALLAGHNENVFWDIPSPLPLDTATNANAPPTTDTGLVADPDINGAVERLAKRLGFEPVRVLTRMHFVPQSRQGQASALLMGQIPRQFGLGDPATG